jgi:hypothetical protein
MSGILVICAATAFMGVDVGWEPADDGGVEYTIQIPPEWIEMLRAGQTLESDIPSDLAGVRGQFRTIRLETGNRRLPRKLPAKTAVEPVGPSLIGSGKPAGTLNVPPNGVRPAPGAGVPWEPPFPKILKPDDSSKSEDAGLGKTAHKTPDKKSGEKSLAAAEHSGETQKPDAKKGAAEDEPSEPQPAKPWLSFWLTLLGLFASLGGNVYLLWVALDFRGRYRAVLAETGGAMVV